MEQTKIKHIQAKEILDSRGNPAVSTEVVLSSGITASASVPSGASRGSYEAFELIDGDKNRYNGLGVLKACENVNAQIAQALLGTDARDQRKLDKTMIELDGTKNKSRLGANAILSVSLACARAVSVESGIPLYKSLQESFELKNSPSLPTPIMNLINGGKHASTNISIQEFQIIPTGFVPVSEKVQAGSQIFHKLGELLKQEGLDFDVGDEGGYAPEVKSIEFLFESLIKSIKSAGFNDNGSIMIGIDSAANSFYNSDSLSYEISPPKRSVSAQELSNLYSEWIKKYPILSIEDPFEEKDWKMWSSFCKKTKQSNIIVIGDDLLVTNKERLKEAIKKDAVGGILIKLNQVGTLSETIDTILCAQKNNIKIIVSHRSGETNDDFISDLAVAVGAGFLKAGAPSRGERVAKYNRLMEIEKTL